MMTLKMLSRGCVLGALLVVLPEVGFGATKPMQLTWADLIPVADQAKQQVMTGVILGSAYEPSDRAKKRL